MFIVVTIPTVDQDYSEYEDEPVIEEPRDIMSDTPLDDTERRHARRRHLERQSSKYAYFNLSTDTCTCMYSFLFDDKLEFGRCYETVFYAILFVLKCTICVSNLSQIRWPSQKDVSWIIIAFAPVGIFVKISCFLLLTITWLWKVLWNWFLCHFVCLEMYYLLM